MLGFHKRSLRIAGRLAAAAYFVEIFGAATTIAPAIPIDTAGSIASNIAGTNSILQGQQNQQKGQQTQNMAQMAMGAMQVAQGLLGLMAGAAAASKGSTAAGRDAGLSGLNDYTPTTYPTGTTTAGSTANDVSTGSLGTAGTATTSSPIGISAADLRTGALGQAMDSIEKNYGIPRDKFADALQAGVDPKDLLANAPKNAPPMDMLSKIEAGLAANNTSAKEAADRILASANAVSQAGGLPPTQATGDAALENAKGLQAPSSTASEELDSLDAAIPMGVSPEVKAAMAARAAQLKAEKEQRERHSWNLFQLVHNRYQKLETMLYGRVERTNASPTSGLKGF
jgi:hypothetical protein